MDKTPQNTLPWLLQKATPIRIAVLGDLILDEYIDGTVNRISPEAPVPVHLVTRMVHTAGGAANVARNIKAAGGEVELFGVFGKDEGAKILRQILQADGISTNNIMTDPDRPTVKKTRITAGTQQIVRVDWEKVHPISAKAQAKLFDSLKQMTFDALLISDYGKGSLPADLVIRAIELAEERRIPAIVDPKGKDYSRYKKAYLVTPNRKEACDALGLDPSDTTDPEELARRLAETFGLRNVLLTLGAKGMLLVTNDTSESESIYLPTEAREVFDVSGAGDTVAAMMSLAIGAGAELSVAMRLANLAAGRVVEKWGTQPITQAELETALADGMGGGQGFSTLAKVTSLTSLRAALDVSYRKQKKIVFTNGCFDILHAGHVTYLEAAKSRGDTLVVAVNTDRSVRALKGATRPIIPCEERMRLVGALACVDYVVSFDADTPAEIIRALQPDILIKGADWPLDRIVGADMVLAKGGKVETIELVSDLSTSAIIRRIQEGA